MGRGTAILRYGSALHSRRLPGPSTQRLFGWLEAQLDMRGIDPAVYSRYLISLLQLDDAEFERSEVSDQELDSAGPTEVKRAGRRSRRKKQQQQQQEKPVSQSDCQSDAAIGLASGVSSRKRAAAVQCLQSACNDPYELDELIDELCYRLRRLNAASTGGFLQPSRRLPLLAEEDSREFDSADSDVAGAGMVSAVADEDSETAAYNADSGQAGTPEESAAPIEEYVCAFPALAEALEDRGRQAAAAGRAADASVWCARSAWARGPPRSLHSLLPHHQHQQSVRRFRRQRRAGAPSTNPIADEGFLEGDEYDDEDEEEDENEAEDEAEDGDGDDAVSVTSEGSEILQLVSHILHSFNREIEDELAAAASAATNASASNSSNCAGAEKQLPPLTLLDLPDIGEIENCGLLTGMSLMEEEAELLSDHDFDNLPSQEEEDEIPSLALLDIDDNLSDKESVDSASVAKPPPNVAMATGIVALPADLVLGRMAQWTSLDRLRCQMWSRKPLPPKPQPQQQQKQTSPSPARRQPMTPLEKSQRACSFLLRGRCKKEDCEFAHDLNRVICKFWSAGECFKGDTCPFLHGLPAESETDD